MQLPTGLPDDHFKKPYLPQQQYINHGPLPLPPSLLFQQHPGMKQENSHLAMLIH